MSVAFLWGGVAIMVLFILIGFLAGFVRGVKRSALHIIFFVLSFVIAFFITKPITSAIMGISITIDGTTSTLNEIVFTMLSKQFDLSAYSAVEDFSKTLPLSVASPIMFILIALITYFLLDIIYLIVARAVFGKKKVEFQEKKPHRLYGGLVGIAEGFLFMFLLFAPLTSLTQTYAQLADNKVETVVAMEESEEQTTSELPTIPDLIHDNVPSEVDEIIQAFNGSVLGKIAGAGGFNNVMYDFLSSSQVNGEEIHLRKDLIAVSETYNEFVKVYNAFQTNNLDNVNLTSLKANFGKFLDEGIFRGVIAPTIQQFVVNFNIETAPDFIAGNDLLVDLVNELKTAFSKPEFVAKTYLKDDLLKIVDIAENVIDSGIVQEFQNLESGNTMEIIKIISENNEKIKEVLQNVSGLHILSDGLDALGNYASEKLSEFFENEDIKLNFDSLDKLELISDSFNAINNALEATKKLDFAKILEGDLMGGIAGVENIDEVLINIGKAFDGIRELDILVHPSTEPDGEDVYVLDEILKKYKFSLLGGDNVHVVVDKPDGTTEEKDVVIDSYENFCIAIARSVKLSQQLDLFHIGTQGSNFEEIIGKVLNKMHEMTDLQQNPDAKSELLSQILLPFYQLQNEIFNSEDEEISVRDLIFDNIISSLDNLIDQINLSAAIIADDYNNWKLVLDDLSTTLLKLDDREHKIEAQTTNGKTKQYTYIMYLLSGDVDDKNKLETLLDNIVEHHTLSGIFKQLVNSSSFDDMITQMFNIIDQQVGALTKLQPQRILNRKELAIGKEDLIAGIIEKLVNFANSHDNLDEINLVEIGELLDSLKQGAQNNGIFKGIFENLIWYITGDQSINPTYYYEQHSTLDQETQDRVKGYLNTSDYYNVDYTTKFTELNEVKNFLADLDEKNLREFDFQNGTNAEQFITEFDNVLNNLGDDANKIKVLQETKTLMDQVAGENSFENLDGTVKSALLEVINQKYKEEQNNQELANAVMALFGISE